MKIMLILIFQMFKGYVISKDIKVVCLCIVFLEELNLRILFAF